MGVVSKYTIGQQTHLSLNAEEMTAIDSFRLTQQLHQIKDN